MDRARFEAIVEAYGADAKRWPEAERAAALVYAARPEAQAILAEARALDAMLDETADASPASLGLRRRALAGAPKPATPAVTWRPIAALAACAVLGVAIGLGGARQAAEAQALAEVLSVAFAAGDVG